MQMKQLMNHDPATTGIINARCLNATHHDLPTKRAYLTPNWPLRWPLACILGWPAMIGLAPR
jgi:hypothetical protein